MHELIASPYMEHFLLVRPGFRNRVNIGRARYEQLAAAVEGGQVPGWLPEAAAGAWPGLDLTGRPVADWLLEGWRIRGRLEVGADSSPVGWPGGDCSAAGEAVGLAIDG